MPDVLTRLTSTLADRYRVVRELGAGSSLTVSPDGRTLYYGASETQSNIWLVRRTEEKQP